MTLLNLWTTNNTVALFIDLSKAFDTVDQLKQRLIASGLAQQTVTCFDNDLSDRTQCVQA